MEERLAFIRLYVKRLKENPDEVFREQVGLINSLLQSAKGFPLTKEECLRMKEARERRQSPSISLALPNSLLLIISTAKA